MSESFRNNEFHLKLCEHSQRHASSGQQRLQEESPVKYFIHFADVRLQILQLHEYIAKFTFPAPIKRSMLSNAIAEGPYVETNYFGHDDERIDAHAQSDFHTNYPNDTDGRRQYLNGKIDDVASRRLWIDKRQ